MEKQLGNNIVQFKNAEFIPYMIELAEQGHNVIIPLRGVSMRPYLEDRRDNAVMARITCPLKVGDVVLAEIMPRQYALHRIISIKENIIRMQGDGNICPDPEIHRENVKLIAKGFYRKGSKKLESTQQLSFLIYSFIWMRLRPVRRYLLAVWRRLPNFMK